MPVYPVVSSDVRVPFAELVDRIQVIFVRCGMSGNDARLMADLLVLADLRGVHSHGVIRVPDYVKKLTEEGVNPRGRPFLASDRKAALVVDGDNAMGQIACHFAMRQAIGRARDLGVAAAAVRGSNHCGALFPYAMMALEEDMIGLVATNALPTMAPWGGCDKIVGMNPFAAAIPSRAEPPIILDAAFSMSSHGKIRVYQQKSLPLPDVIGGAAREGIAAESGLMPIIAAAPGHHWLNNGTGKHKKGGKDSEATK